MTPPRIQIVIKRPGTPPHIAMIADTIPAIREALGGAVAVWVSSPSMLLLVNEDAEADGLSQNVRRSDGKIAMGPVAIIANRPNASLSAAETEIALELLRSWSPTNDRPRMPS